MDLYRQLAHEPRDFGHEAVIDAINQINAHATTSKKVVLINCAARNHP
jgi:hypothetical protein